MAAAMRSGGQSFDTVTWGTYSCTGGRTNGSCRRSRWRPWTASTSPPTARYAVGVTGWNVATGPIRTVNGSTDPPTARSSASAAGSSSSRTFTGCTSVMCGATSVSAPSPSARRIPSTSVAHGSGNNNATATRRLATKAHSGVTHVAMATWLTPERVGSVGGGGRGGCAGDLEADLGAGEGGLGVLVVGVAAEGGFGCVLRPLRPVDVDLLRQLGDVGEQGHSVVGHLHEATVHRDPLARPFGRNDVGRPDRQAPDERRVPGEE